MRGLLASLLLLFLALPACGGCSEEGALDKEGVRLWGRDKLTSELAEKAKDPIDASSLDERPDVKSRVLSMSFGEVVARLGFLEYKGVAKFKLSRNKHQLEVEDDTTITHGLHGTFRVLQKDADGAISREAVYNNGVFYVRNGPGKMRVQGLVDNQHLQMQSEAWDPLRVYTSYYGPRAGLRRVGSATVNSRSTMKYELVLLDGSPLVTVPGMKGAKRPVSLSGHLWVDEQTGAPVKADFSGLLEIPGTKDGIEPGKLRLSLKFEIKTVEGQEIRPGEFVPTIRRRDVDLAPLAFLDGGTRTSTVIGGPKKPAASRPPTDEDP